jgi:hypothetical protein
VEAIVVSPQFLNRQTHEIPNNNPAPIKPVGGKLIKADFRKEH